MGSVSVAQRRYKRAQSYKKKGSDGNLRRSDDRIAEFEKSRPHVIGGGITVTMYEIARATDVDNHGSFTASLDQDRWIFLK